MIYISTRIEGRNAFDYKCGEAQTVLKHWLWRYLFRDIYAGIAQLVRAPVLQTGGPRFKSLYPHHLILLKKEDMYMKKPYCELEFYAERRYIAYSYSKHYIKALYWLLKYKYYKKRHEQQFNS